MILFFLLTGFLSLSIQAKPNEEGMIYKIDYGINNESPLIFLDNGRVIEIQKKIKHKVSVLEKALTDHSLITFEVNQKNEITNFNIEPKKQKIKKSVPFHDLESTKNFIPSIIENYSTAYHLFQNARKDFTEESQCYNRAHIWAYEWRINHNLYSSKVWLFFTQKYIRKYKFEWWFHVAPMIHVAVDNQVKQRIMDIKYSKRPEKINDWSNIFVRTNEPCPVVESFSDYANSPESGSCYVLKSSMYQYIPLDLEEEELKGSLKTKWLRDEIKQAYLNGFNLTI